MTNATTLRSGNTKCVICEFPCTRSVESAELFHYTCDFCGEFSTSRIAFHTLNRDDLSPRQRVNISGWVRENRECMIDEGLAQRLTGMQSPTFHERADKLLMALEKETTFAGETITRTAKWIGFGWFLNDSEVFSATEFLKETKRIKEVSPATFIIAPNGWAHLEELRKKGADSQQGFVAMWFDDNLKPIYANVISKAIEDAGYKPHRVDERDHNGRIDDEIIAQIRRSRFVVADFTGHRGGVYYEAGFAQGLGLEVIWTCRKDGIDDLHFDIRQYNCIDWDADKPEDFRKRLVNRIESVLGRGHSS